MDPMLFNGCNWHFKNVDYSTMKRTSMMKFYSECRPWRTLTSREFRSQNLRPFLPQNCYFMTFDLLLSPDYPAPLGPTTPITPSVKEYPAVKLDSVLPVSALAVSGDSGNIWKWKYLELPEYDFRQTYRDCSRGRVQLVAGISNFSVEGILRGEGGKVKLWPPISPPWGVRGHPKFFGW